MGEPSDSRWTIPPPQDSAGREAQWSKRSWFPSTKSTLYGLDSNQAISAPSSSEKSHG